MNSTTILVDWDDERIFKAKDLVFVKSLKKRTGINNKFAPQWRGLFEIIEMTSSVTAKIKEFGKAKPRIIHVNNLKKLVAAANLSTSREDDESLVDDDDDDDPETNDNDASHERAEAEDEPEAKSNNDDTNNDAEAEDEPNYPRTIAKEEIIPDADMEAERDKYVRHTRSQGPVREHPLVH